MSLKMERHRILRQDIEPAFYNEVPQDIPEDPNTPELTPLDQGIQFFSKAITTAAGGRYGHVGYSPYIPYVVSAMDEVGVDPNVTKGVLETVKKKRNWASFGYADDRVLALLGESENIQSQRWGNDIYKYAIDHAIRQGEDPSNLIARQLTQLTTSKKPDYHASFPDAEPFCDLARQLYQIGEDPTIALTPLEQQLDEEQKHAGYRDNRTVKTFCVTQVECNLVDQAIESLQRFSEDYDKSRESSQYMIGGIAYGMAQQLIKQGDYDDVDKVLDVFGENDFLRAEARAKKARQIAETEGISPVSAIPEIRELLEERFQNDEAFKRIYPEIAVAYAKAGDLDQATSYLTGCWEAAYEMEFSIDRTETLLAIANAIQDIGADATGFYRAAFESATDLDEDEKGLNDYFGVSTDQQHDVAIDAAKRGNIKVAEELAEKCSKIDKWESVMLFTEIGRQYLLRSKRSEEAFAVDIENSVAESR